MSGSLPNYKRTRRACFFAYLAMSSVFSLPPLLFVSFREMYGVSYTLLGTLVLVNFCTQLLIDLLFSFFPKMFNIKVTVRAMPLITSLGLFIYALVPTLFPQYAYVGLLTGTVIFSVSAGLAEVLISPLVAAMPSETPDRDMSMFHSLYAYGVVTVVAVSTLFLKIFTAENWMYLTCFWATLPIISSILFFVSPIPELNVEHGAVSSRAKGRTFGIALCMLCIFIGGAAEITMTNWISGYMENALGISKAVGDVLGMTLFAVLLGVGRTLYAKFGRNISMILLGGMACAAVCYVVAGVSSNVVVSLIACVLVGLCTSMLWPGTLIFMEEKFPNPGVAAYALMAAGGDLGGSVGPQLLGIVIDKVSASAWATQLGAEMNVSVEQIGMKVGVLSAAIFPIIGTILVLYMRSYFKKAESKIAMPTDRLL